MANETRGAIAQLQADMAELQGRVAAWEVGGTQRQLSQASSKQVPASSFGGLRFRTC